MTRRYGKSWLSLTYRPVSNLRHHLRVPLSLKLYLRQDDETMALFGSDRPVMPTFKTPPELDSAARSPFDDLNRLDRSSVDIRAQERLERVLERNGGGVEREERPAIQEPEPPVAILKPAVAPAPAKKQNGGTDPLIEGLFSKLPVPESEWPLAARQKWLQTAANIFDLMYAPGEADGGEVAIRVERSNGRG